MVDKWKFELAELCKVYTQRDIYNNMVIIEVLRDESTEDEPTQNELTQDSIQTSSSGYRPTSVVSKKYTLNS